MHIGHLSHCFTCIWATVGQMDRYLGGRGAGLLWGERATEDAPGRAPGLKELAVFVGGRLFRVATVTLPAHLLLLIQMGTARIYKRA